MSGAGQLKLLQLRKAVLQLSLARRRVECAEAIDRIAGPIRRVESIAVRVYAWRKFVPALVALWGLRPRRAGARRFGIATIVRWLPLVLNVWRMRRAAAAAAKTDQADESFVPPVADDIPDDVKAERRRQHIAGDAEG